MLTQKKTAEMAVSFVKYINHFRKIYVDKSL